LSVAIAQPSSRGERELEEALNHAAKREVIVVTAAGNQGLKVISYRCLQGFRIKAYILSYFATSTSRF
jgi:hypothetical protein